MGQEFKPSHNVTGMHHRGSGIAAYGNLHRRGTWRRRDDGASSPRGVDGNYYSLGRQAIQIPAHAVTPHAAGDKTDVAAFRALPQISHDAAENAATHGGVGVEGCSCNGGKNSRLDGRLDPAAFP